MKYNKFIKLDTTRISLRKLCTIFTLLLISTFTILAETETQPSSVPASNSAIVGTSYTLSGTYNAGGGSVKVGAMTSKGVKFRTNRSAGDYSNAIQFTVNSGYEINGITIIGVTNNNDKAATIGSIYVDDVAYGTSFDGNVPAKNASTASNVVVTGINATSSVIFVFSDLNGTTQANLEYTITYSTAGGGSCTTPTCAWATTPADGAIGGSMTASVTTNYAAGLTWTSSDPLVASLTGTGTSRTINYLTAGTTTITASVTGDGSTYCDDAPATVSQLITVSAPVAVTGVTLDKSTMDLVVGGGTGTLTPTITPAGATDKVVTWESSDPSVATVADGVVTPIAAGPATITVKTHDGSFTATCEVTVTAPVIGDNEIIPAYITPVSNWYERTGVGRVTNKTGAAFSSPDYASDCSPTGFKTGSNNFTLQTYKAIIGVIVRATGGSNRTISTVKTGAATGSLSTLTVDDDYTVSGTVVKNDCDNTFTILFTSTIAADQYVNITASGNFDVISVELILPCAGPTNTSPAFAAATYDVDDVATPLVASATAGSGGALSYKWYQNTSASKVGAVEAEGTNNEASYTPSTEYAGTHYYYCVISEAGCAKTTSTAISGAITVTDPCDAWGYGTTNTTTLSSGGTISEGDLSLTSTGGLTSSSVRGFSGSGNLAYNMYFNADAKILAGSLGGKKIGKIKFSAATSSTSSENNTIFIAFSSSSTFDAEHLIEYSEDVDYHIITVPNYDSPRESFIVNAPNGAKSFAIGRNSKSTRADGTMTSTSNRYLYFISVCESDDCTPDFSVQPTDATVDLGASVTLSVNSDDATSYQWYRNTTKSTTGATLIPSATAKTYSPSTAAAGVTYYYCVISKSGCPTTNTSDIVAVTVLQGCDDEIITEVLVGGGSTITSSTGCTATANLESIGKLGGSKYLRIALSEGYFADGDVVYVNLNTVGDMGGGKLALVYGTESSYSGGVATTAVTGDNKLVLSGVPANLTTISIPRAYDFGEGTVEQNHVLSKETYTVKVERLVCHACPQPTIGSQPTDAQYCSGSSVALTVGSITGGTTPYSYQWYKDGVAIPSATAATYNASAAGAYQCKVSSDAGCFVRSAIANVTGLTAVTASWATAPADAAVGAPNMTAAVTTNYSDGLVWTSTAPLVASVSSTGEITYISEGSATIKATVTGDAEDGYCGTEVLSQTITVAAPSCTSYSFHWGASVGAEDNLICFTQKGTSTTYLSSLFTIPTANDAYYVGWQGYWNTTSANSANAYMTGMYYALNTNKTLSRAEAGNVGGAQGYLRVFSDSSDPNKYVGFIPAGYGMRIGDDDPIALLPKTADIEEINWQSDIVELTADMLLTTTKYDVRLKTSDSYVWAEGRSQESTIKGMKIRNGASTFRATYLGDADAGLYGKFAIFADSGDPNWYCYFIPYWGVSFNLNGGESWAGVAPDRVSVEGNDAARTITIPSKKPVRKGYHFLGWDTNSAATAATYKAGDNIILTSDITLYAIWEEIELLPLACDDDFTGSEIAADGAFSGTHYESGFSTNEKFFIIGDATKTSNAGGTPEQKTATAVKINSIDFTEFIYLKGAAALDGSGIPTDRAIKFKVAQAGRLTVYFKDGKNIRLFKEGGEPVALSDETGTGFGTYGVEAGTYYIYATAGSTNIVGISFECCPSVTKYEISEKNGISSMCPGSNATIRLANSQTGITYQLFKGDVLVKSSNKAGTGSALDWAITEPGTYTVKSYDEYCPAVEMTGSVTITNPGANITGNEELMRTESIVLTADKKGGTWALVDPADAPKLGLGIPDETDGVTSKLTVTGLKEGTVNVKYSLNGCETIHTVKVTEYIVCNEFTVAADRHADFADGTWFEYATTSGNLSSSKTGTITSKDICDATRFVYTQGDFLIKFPHSVTKIILYCSNASNILSLTSIKTTKEPKTSSTSYTDYTTFTSTGGDAKGCQVVTITCNDGKYLSKDDYIYIKLSNGTANIYNICYKPVDCSDLIVTPSGSTLNSGETVTLTASITDGKFTTTNSDKILLTDNGDGTATVKALSLMSAADVIVVYTRPNGCEFETPIHVNADPCPEPTVTLYTAKEQVLGTDQPLILSGIGATSTGTLSYKWYSNSSASTLGATEITGAAFADFITTTASSATDTYYFLRVTNTVGVNSKSVNSDFIKITTTASCVNQVLISANVHTSTASITDEFDADGGIIGGKLIQKTDKNGKIGSNGHYVFVQLAEGNFQAGDVFSITSSVTPTKLYLYYDNADNKYIKEEPITKTASAGIATEYTLTQADIAAGVTNKLGLWRQADPSQNPTVTSISVSRPFCFDNKTTCLDDVVNFAVCEVAPAPETGYSYEWKVDDGDVAGTKSSFTITSDTENHQVVCYIKKGDAEQATQSFNITGDGTAFTFSKTRYFRGEKETLTPVTLGGTWSSSDDTKATISSDGVFEVITTSNDDITITYTNANGCSHSETVTVGDPYFVFTNASGDMKWSTVGNWSYATSAPYKPVDLTGILPNLNSKVILLEPCVVDIPNANANYIRIATGTAGEVTGNGKLNILPTGALTVATTVQMFEADGTNFGSGKKVAEGLLTIEASPAGQGALAFVENNNAMLPQATVIQYLKGYYPVDEPEETTWQYMGVPFSDAAPFIYSFYGGWVQQWNESSAQWSYASHETDISTYPEAQPQMFTGYAYTQKDNESGVYYDNRGTLVPTQNTTINLEFTNASRGRNLLANSWTSPIYLNKMIDDDFANTEKIFYVFGTGSYKKWLESYTENTINPQTVDSEPAPGQYLAIPVFSGSYTGRGTIAPQQGFFIYAKNSGASVTFDYERVVHNITETTKETRPRLSPAAKREQDAVSLTKITVMSDNGADQAYILTGKETFTNGYEDGWDGKKMEGLSSMPSLSIETPSGRMQISAQPQLLGTTFNFRAGSDDFYELIITTNEQDLMLKDMQENITIALQDTTRYAFFANNKVSSSRFCIVKKPSVVTYIDNEYGSLLNVYLSEDGKIVINNFTGEKQVVNMYDMTGKQLLSIPAVSEITTINAPAQGAYLIKVGKQVFKIIRK